MLSVQGVCDGRRSAAVLARTNDEFCKFSRGQNTCVCMVVTTVIMFGRAVWLRRRGIDAWAHDQVGMFLGMAGRWLAL